MKEKNVIDELTVEQDQMVDRPTSFSAATNTMASDFNAAIVFRYAKHVAGL